MRMMGCVLLALLGCCDNARGDWLTVRGDAARTGLVQGELRPPFRLAWARHFAGQRMGSNLEPIIAAGKLFVGTHQGNLYALDATTGELAWHYPIQSPLLHSPACEQGLVLAADAAGSLHAIEIATGRPRWTTFVSPGGFAASPTVADGMIFLGSRSGEFLAVDLNGKIRWRTSLPAPVRQTAAFHNGRVFITAEDLRVHCFESRTGKAAWESEPLWGQTVRDSHPVVVSSSARALVVVRTNPVVNMGQRIAEDRHLLCQAAGVDDRDWRALDAWTKSEPARGTPELWAKEQSTIVRHLHDHPEARSFFVLDAVTGRETGIVPVLWCAGCQGVGTPPVVLPDGRLLVLYRSAYGHWNHGVAPLVALGLLDPAGNRIVPLEHAGGKQPPWNTFWGTADESQNFAALGNTVLMIHQSTVSGFDRTSGRLFPIWGERDSWGGFRNLPWARNEWNGPARSGAAISGGRIYWQTGSRVLCLVPGDKGPAIADQAIDNPRVPESQERSAALAPEAETTRQRLGTAVEQVLAQRWAPLYVEPGLAGREFFFSQSGDLFLALARAYPHLPAETQQRVRARLAEEWKTRPPLTPDAAYPLDQGARREWFRVPKEALSRLGHDRLPHRFANTYAVWLYAERCGAWAAVREAWPQIRACFDDFVGTRWQLDARNGDPLANRYLASTIALSRIARQCEDADVARQAEQRADRMAEALAGWWRQSAERVRLVTVPSIREWDDFIGRGDALFVRAVPHKSKLALFQDLTPEVAALAKAKAPEATEKVWQTFEALCPTWHLVGEERQVHYGENFLDPPDFALDAFTALAWLRDPTPAELARRLDIPFCRADLCQITKLAVLLDRTVPSKR